MKFENAENYDKFALAQKEAAINLCDELKLFKKKFKQVFEIGCGSGILTGLVKKHFSFENLILNDLYKTAFMSEFPFVIGDILKLQIPKSDLIISASVFQWIDDLKLLSTKLHEALDNNGILAFSMFISGTLIELSSFTKQGLDYKTSEQIKEIFSENFDIKKQINFSHEVKFSSLHELLNSLKQTGVNNINGDFKLTKSSLNALNIHFNNNFKLSYNYTILICKKRK